MPDGIIDAIGMPLGAVAKRLEVEGKTKITCHGNMPYTLLRGSLVWQVRSKSPHLPALSPAESHRRQVRMAGDFRVRLAGGSLSEKYIISQFHPFQSIAGGRLCFVIPTFRRGLGDGSP